LRELPILAGRLLTALVGIVVALIVCEFAVRFYRRVPLLPIVPPEPYIDNAVLYRPSPTRLYELRPGVDALVGRQAIHIHINAAGQRDDRDLPTEKPQGVFRVVVLGDSFTFGGKVPLEQSFSKSLERALGAFDRSGRYEVVNLAVPGYNTEQEMLALKEAGLPYHPDLVIVNYVLNDGGRMVQLIPRNSRLPLGLRRVLKRSDLVQYVYASVKYLQYRLHGGASREADKYTELSAGTPGWEASRAALVEIARLASSARAATLVVVWPMLVDLGQDYPHRAKHEFVVSECRRLGIPVLDLLLTFEGRDASVLWAAKDDHHPNGTALGMGAEAVVRDLAAQRMLRSTVEAAR
jgi:GDSL-like Lipase/Acylhydrolase family